MSSPAPTVRIERLALRVAGLDEDAARSLARLVAEGLAPDLVRSPGLAGLDHLEVEVSSTSSDADLLAEQIAAAVGRALVQERRQA
jgi:hypothetical protein